MTAPGVPEQLPGQRSGQHGRPVTALVPGGPPLLRWLLPCRLATVLGTMAASGSPDRVPAR
jgi:hypothetical protein